MPKQLRFSETVLWYCPDPIPALEAEKVFLAQGIKVVRVTARQMGGTVEGLLRGGTPPETGAFPPPSRPILVLAGFTRPRLDALLAAMREAGVSVAYKAMLTPANASWTLRVLYAELAREHAGLHG